MLLAAFIITLWLLIGMLGVNLFWVNYNRLILNDFDYWKHEKNIKISDFTYLKAIMVGSLFGIIILMGSLKHFFTKELKMPE